MIAGELTREEDVLEWLVQNKSTGDEEDVIEDVTAKTLETLIGSIDNLVVLFCKCLDVESMEAKCKIKFEMLTKKLVMADLVTSLIAIINPLPSFMFDQLIKSWST